MLWCGPCVGRVLWSRDEEGAEPGRGLDTKPPTGPVDPPPFDLDVSQRNCHVVDQVVPE